MNLKTLRLCLLAGLLPTQVYAMEPEQQRTLKHRKQAPQQNTTALNFKENEKLLQKVPRTLAYLLIMGPHLPNTVTTLRPIHPDLLDASNNTWLVIHDGSPVARQKFLNQCKVYLEAKRRYMRAQKALQQNPEDKTLKTNERNTLRNFEKCQAYFLRKYPSVNKDDKKSSITNLTKLGDLGWLENPEIGLESGLNLGKLEAEFPKEIQKITEIVNAPKAKFEPESPIPVQLEDTLLII